MQTIADYLAPSTNKKWYEEYPKSQSACSHSKPELTVLNLKDEGKRHLEAETTAYQLKQSKSRNSEYGWFKTALSQGTSSDKVAASVILLQDSPKHNLARLTSLVSQVKAAKQNQCNTITTALRDLFLSDLLHPKFKLLKFEEQDLDKLDTLNVPSNNKKGVPFMSKNKLLAHWYFEDQLKEIYEKFVVSLSQIASNTVDSNREKVVSIMNDLLMGNSEQEHKLLDSLVNKIGDPSNKVSSKVIFCLNKLLYEHSNMKVVVLREVEKLLFRSNVSPRAQYYAICLLTQFVLDRDDIETANSLIDVYFAFFKACLKKGEPDSRMMAAILTGVNRAYRFSKVDSQKLNDHIDSLYKVVHVGSYNVSLNALSLLFQVVGKNEQQMNRFYSAFYRKLSDPQIGVGNKRAIFLNLLYRVLQKDHSVIRLKAFLKRIFQYILQYPANMACATLYVVSQVLKARKDAQKIVCWEPEVKIEKDAEEEDGEEEIAKIKSDCKKSKSESKKSKSESKKSNSESKRNKPESKKSKSGSEKSGSDSEKSESNSENSESNSENCESSSENSESDNDDSEDEKLEEDNIMISNLIVDTSKVVSKKDEVEIKEEPVVIKEEFDPEKEYNPFCRNPLGSGAHNTFYYELFALVNHFHPSVALFANNIKEGQPIDYSGDPLEDLNLIRFLDRYVYKNPKKLESKKVTRKGDPLAKRAAYVPQGMRSIPVDSEAYLNERQERIPVDELFLYEFLKKRKDLRIKPEDDDNDSVTSEDFNAMLDGLAEGENLDDIDIAGDITTKRKKKGEESEDDESDEDFGDEDEENEDFDEDMEENDFDEDMEENDFNDVDELEDDLEDEEFDDENMDDDYSDIDFDDEASDEDALREELSLMQKGGKFAKKRSKDSEENVFMSAEKFAEMMEEQGHSKSKHGASNSMNTSDGAGPKQLKWEAKRNQRFPSSRFTKKGKRTKNFTNKKNAKKQKR